MNELMKVFTIFFVILIVGNYFSLNDTNFYLGISLLYIIGMLEMNRNEKENKQKCVQ